MSSGTIIVYTNCQGQGLIKLLAQHGALAGYTFVHLKAWLQEAPSTAQLDDCRIMIYQPAWGELSFRNRIPAQTKQIAIPLLSCAVLWPYAFDKPDEPAGWRFPYGDRNLIAKIKQGLSPEQAVNAYFDEDLGKTIKLDKLLQLEQHKWRSNDQQTEIRLSEFIAGHIFHRRLFFTPDHPTDFLLIELANQILKLLDLAPFNQPDWQTYTHSLQGVEVPIHPSIVRRFSIPYQAPDHHYPLFGGWLTMTERDYFNKYATALLHPTYQEALAETVTALAEGDFNTALNISTLIREKEPLHPGAMAVQAVASALLGNKNHATALLGQIISRQGAAN